MLVVSDTLVKSVCIPLDGFRICLSLYSNEHYPFLNVYVHICSSAHSSDVELRRRRLDLRDTLFITDVEKHGLTAFKVVRNYMHILDAVNKFAVNIANTDH